MILKRDNKNITGKFNSPKVSILRRGKGFTESLRDLFVGKEASRFEKATKRKHAVWPCVNHILD